MGHSKLGIWDAVNLQMLYGPGWDDEPDTVSCRMLIVVELLPEEAAENGLFPTEHLSQARCYIACNSCVW